MLQESGLVTAEPNLRSRVLDFDPSDGRTRVRLDRILIDYGVSTVAMDWTNVAAGMDRLTLRLHMPRRHLRELLDDLVGIGKFQNDQPGAPEPTRSVLVAFAMCAINTAGAELATAGIPWCSATHSRL